MINHGIAAKSFIVNNNKLLIIKRAANDVQQPDSWEIPGGRLEPGENPKDGVIRETKEETGIDIEVIQPINVRHFTRDDGQIITMLVFLCNALNTNIKISEEHSAYEWIPLENCKKKLTNFFHDEIDIYNNLELHRLLK